MIFQEYDAYYGEPVHHINDLDNDVHASRFVVVRHGRILGERDTFDDAKQVGYDLCHWHAIPSVLIYEHGLNIHHEMVKAELVGEYELVAGKMAEA